MDPHREKPKTAKVRPEEKRKRFRLIKLDERITPGAHASHKFATCTCGSGTASIE
jgi:hypothetical protein